MLPRNLVFVRHGQSTRNLAGKLAWEGDLKLFEEIITRPSSLAPLTDLGEKQVRAAGKWLVADGISFDRWYTSSFVRAKQTAGLLGLPHANWYIENNIRERSGGVMEDMLPDQRTEYLRGIRNRAHHFDPFNFRPDRGESYADITMRLRFFLETLHRERGKENVIVANHGDIMWVIRYLIERWTPEDFVKAREGDAYGKMENGMILHYTRVDPETGLETKYAEWMRTCCPWRNVAPTPWRRIVRRKYTSEELLQQVKAAAEFSQKEPAF